MSGRAFGRAVDIGRNRRRAFSWRALDTSSSVVAGESTGTRVDADLLPHAQTFASRSDDSPGASLHPHIRSDVIHDADGTVAAITDNKRQFEDKCRSAAYKCMAAELSSERRRVDLHRDRALTSVSSVTHRAPFQARIMPRALRIAREFLKVRNPSQFFSSRMFIVVQTTYLTSIEDRGA
jgi:hypothetical protein